jgi:hypothetical protein
LKLKFKKLSEAAVLPRKANPTDAGFTGQYYDNQTMSGLPVLVRKDANINFDWGDGSPDTSVPNDHFSVRWTKSQTFTPGTYRFTTTSDDGVRLKIDGTTYIEKWIDQSSKQYQADVVLDSEIKIESDCQQNNNDGNAHFFVAT